MVSIETIINKQTYQNIDFPDCESVPYWLEFPVFMWRNHIPKLNITFPSEALGLSDKRSYRNLTFHNVLARQGSSYCNRARLNFMKMATREGCRVSEKMSYHFSFANWAVLALEETFISVCRSSIAIILRFTSKTQWQMFLLLYGRHVCVPQEDTNMASPYKAL